MKILLTGATGLVGGQLGVALTRAGHHITALTRDGNATKLGFPARVIAWDHKSILDPRVLSPDKIPFSAVIHLSGEPVAQRWTASSKKRIYDSRVISTKSLSRSVESLLSAQATWINASAIGFYGVDGPQAATTEGAPPGTGFLADVCKDWEAACPTGELRTIKLRLGVILSHEGGALPKMTLPFHYGFGGPIGDGQQALAWIHIDDTIAAIMHCLNTPSIRGPINVVAPECVSNTDFSSALAKVMGTWSLLPAPAVALRLLLGEMSSMLTQGVRVKPDTLLASGFQFQYPTVAIALRQLFPESLPRGARVYTARQWIDGSPEQNFPFFSAAENLERITPPWLHFRITGKSSETMGSGLLIDYKLRIKGLPVRWRTRIEDWNPPKSFVDTQLRGPYKIWHHTHNFEPLGGGTLMTDRVIYKMRFWPFGDVALPMVKQDVKTIFGYRRKVLADLKR
jgi:uncharacterized protein (TIGR01777 family)